MEEQLAAYLKTRRSVPAAQLSQPAPSPAALRGMLEAAVRVPDHGKLAPWRFIVFERETREAAVDGLKRIAAKHPDEKERRFRADKIAAFAGSPVVVGVISAPVVDHPRIPLWEQQLSAGAVCMNLLHAANASGYAAQWLTGWFAYDEEARRWLGLKPGEKVAGFIHMGTPTELGLATPDRDRPKVEALTTSWSG
jgi:nitroreductase